MLRRGALALGAGAGAAAVSLARLPQAPQDPRKRSWGVRCEGVHDITTGARQHGPLRILTGNAHPQLANEIAKKVGVELSPSTVNQFKNGEIQVLLKESMRGCDVYVVQPTCNPDPNTTLMELLIMVDAARRGGAERITAVMPIYAYARQDKKDRSRAPITGKLVADMIEVAGANRVVTIDLHASQIQGFVTYPLDNLYAMPLLESFLLQHFADRNIPQDDIVVVSPDAGAAKRAQYLATAIGDVPLAIFSKQRLRPNEVAKMILVGEVKDKVCVIIDDMADTCGTLVLAAKELKQAGAKEVIAVITHGIFSSDALDKINKSELAMVVCTDSIPMHENEKKCPKLKVISVADLLARSIVGAHLDQSMESLFKWDAPGRPSLSH